MKRIFCWSALMALMMLATSCDKDNKEPEQKDKLFLAIDQNGDLADFPLPFLDFTKGQEEVIAWEKDYKSSMQKETFGDEKAPGVRLKFVAQTQQELNPDRTYELTENKLKIVSVRLVRQLLFTENEKTLKANVSEGLRKEGFIEDKKIEGHIYFKNNARKVTIDIPVSTDKYAIVKYYTTPGEQPVSFIKWLQLNENNELIALPIPFVDFTKGKEDAKQWEAQYNSSLAKETDTELSFQTNDPEALNVERSYEFSKKGLLVASSYSIASRLILNMEESETNLNDNFEILLHNNGYSEIKEKKGDLAYDNGSLEIRIKKSSDTPEQTIVTIKASAKSAKYSFNPKAKDFPLFIGDKNLTEYNIADIDKHENGIGRTFSEKSSTAGENRVYITDPSSSNLNLHKVIYDIKDGVNKDGSERKAGIVAYSFTISGAMLEQQAVKDYITNQGFEFEKIIDLNHLKAYKYINKALGFSLLIANSGDKFTLWSFSKYKKVSDTPVQEKKREEFYLPIFEWGSTIDENNPIIAKEKARKFSADVKPADPDDMVAARPTRIESKAPFDIDYAKQTKSGVDGFTYTEDKTKNKPGIVSKIDMVMTQGWDKNKRTFEDEGLVAFLTKEGFEIVYKEKDYVVYYSKKYNVTLQMSMMFNSMVAYFTYGEPK